MCDHVEYGAMTAITSSQDLTIDIRLSELSSKGKCTSIRHQVY